jgi:hypothetical protein
MVSRQVLRQLIKLSLVLVIVCAVVALVYVFVLPKGSLGGVEPSQLALTGDDTGLNQVYYQDYSNAGAASEGNAETANKLSESGFEKGFYRFLSEPTGLGVGSVAVKRVKHVVARFSTAEGARRYLDYVRQQYSESKYQPFEVPGVGDDRLAVRTGTVIDVMGSLVSVLQYTVSFVKSNFYEKIEYVGTDPASINEVKELALKAAGKIS